MVRNAESEANSGSVFDQIVGQPLRLEVNGKIEERCGSNGRSLTHQDLLRGIGLGRLLAHIERSLIESGVNSNILGAITRLKVRVEERQEFIWKELGGENLPGNVQEDVDRMRGVYPLKVLGKTLFARH